MSIRSTVLASLFLVLSLFLAATGWIAKEAMAVYQQDLLNQVRAELLEQSAGDFKAAARQFCHLYEALSARQQAPNASFDRAQLSGALETGQYLAFDTLGDALPGASNDGQFQSLISKELVVALNAKAGQGEDSAVTIDNFRPYMEGAVELPAIVHLRAIPAEGIVIGVGQTLDLAEVRLDSLARVGAAQIARLVWRNGGIFVLLVMLTLSLAWVALHLVFFRPLVNTFSFAGIGSATGRLSWADLKEYACHLREVSDQKDAIRSKLEQETESRFQAEEERDRVKHQLDHALGKLEKVIEARYADRLQEAQSQLMRREARAVKRYFQTPLESARAAAADQGADQQLLEVLDRSIDTVRSLAENGGSIPHTPRTVSLQPWLETLIHRFSREHGVEVQSSIQNGMQVQIDPASLENALEHVLENALEASTPNSPISVDAVPVDRTVEIRIVDRGAGIDATARAHILAPFFTLGEDRDGLGLAITRSVIRRHGGRLDFRSELEKGTAVIITLPLATPQD